MEDLLGAYPTISAWLANHAMDARFELARFLLERDKYTELSSLDRFLRSVASARVKYPVRMKNLGGKLSQLGQEDLRYHESLEYLESQLFEILSYPGLKNETLVVLSNDKIVDCERKLLYLAEALFKIDRDFSQDLRGYLDTQGV
jgi:hypothetical protein